MKLFLESMLTSRPFMPSILGRLILITFLSSSIMSIKPAFELSRYSIAKKLVSCDQFELAERFLILCSGKEKRELIDLNAIDIGPKKKMLKSVAGGTSVVLSDENRVIWLKKTKVLIKAMENIYGKNSLEMLELYHRLDRHTDWYFNDFETCELFEFEALKISSRLNMSYETVDALYWICLYQSLRNVEKAVISENLQLALELVRADKPLAQKHLVQGLRNLADELKMSDIANDFHRLQLENPPSLKSSKSLRASSWTKYWTFLRE